MAARGQRFRSAATEEHVEAEILRVVGARLERRAQCKADSDGSTRMHERAASNRRKEGRLKRDEATSR